MSAATYNRVTDEGAANDNHANRAADALVHRDYEYRDDPDSAIVDLLTDLRHLCERDAHDFDRALAMSQKHFNAEVDEVQS